MSAYAGAASRGSLTRFIPAAYQGVSAALRGFEDRPLPHDDGVTVGEPEIAAITFAVPSSERLLVARVKNAVLALLLVISDYAEWSVFEVPSPTPEASDSFVLTPPGMAAPQIRFDLLPGYSSTRVRIAVAVRRRIAVAPEVETGGAIA